MQWIADNLFVGNKLATGQIRTSDGIRVDLCNIKSPIIVFCSWGDDITPPQQALNWILDLYHHEREIIANGQTIVYTLHQSTGHLGIFVSGNIANKEHDQFVSCAELIDALPPGLYEAVITEVDENTANPDLVYGRYLFRLEVRTLMTSERWAAMTRRTAGALPLLQGSRTSIWAFIGPSSRRL